MAIVMAISCTHLPCMRKGYISFLKKTAEKWGVNRFVHLGDWVSFDSISFHEKNPALYSATDEFWMAKKLLKRFEEVSPRWDWLIGNHDCLPERQAAGVGLSSIFLKGYNELWNVPYKVHPRYSKLEIDGVLYSHGESGKGGQQAALKQAKDNFQSTVIGHYHAQAGITYAANEKELIFGMSVGCGLDRMKLALEYSWKFPAKPILGAGIIIHGKQAYFEPMRI